VAECKVFPGQKQTLPQKQQLPLWTAIAHELVRDWLAENRCPRMVLTARYRFRTLQEPTADVAFFFKPRADTANRGMDSLRRNVFQNKPCLKECTKTKSRTRPYPNRVSASAPQSGRKERGIRSQGMQCTRTESSSRGVCMKCQASTCEEVHACAAGGRRSLTGIYKHLKIRRGFPP
jgi:hypothetical protein